MKQNLTIGALLFIGCSQAILRAEPSLSQPPPNHSL